MSKREGKKSVYDYMEYSTYVEGEKRADVIRTVGEKKNFFGVRFMYQNNNLGIEWYPDHSEKWSEDCAENWVMGIKETPIIK